MTCRIQPFSSRLLLRRKRRLFLLAVVVVGVIVVGVGVGGDGDVDVRFYFRQYFRVIVIASSDVMINAI